VGGGGHQRAQRRPPFDPPGPIALTGPASRRQPRPWAGMLPGDLVLEGKSTLPTGWLANRLGLVDAWDRLPARRGAADEHRALAFYLDVVLDAGSYGEGGREGYRRWAALFKRQDEDGWWGWTPPRRTIYPPAPPGARARPLSYGDKLGLRHVLGSFWRARVFQGLGTTPGELFEDDPVDPLGTWVNRLFTRMERSSCKPRLLDLVLGPERDEVGLDAARLSRERLMLPRRERWWRCGSGTDRVRYVVVDLDAHNLADRGHLRERVRLLMESPFIPHPQLVTTSPRGGRHLWYFLVERTGAVRREGVRTRKPSHAEGFRRALVDTLELYAGPGVIEVFPTSDAAGALMPALPFGPGSSLCGPDGWEVEEPDPIRAMVSWHRRWVGTGLLRINGQELAEASADGAPDRALRVCRSKPPSVLAHEARQQARMRHAGELTDGPGHAQIPDLQDVDGVDDARQAPSRPRGMTIEEAEEVWEVGPQDGRTNDQMLVLARLFRFHRGQPGRDDPTVQDEAAVLDWLGQRVGGRRSWWLGKFQTAFRTALFPFASAVADAVRPAMEDTRWAARQVIAGAASWGWRERKRLLVLLLFLVGRARAREGDGDEDSWSWPLAVSSTEVQDRWLRAGSDRPGKARLPGFRECRELLIDRDLLRITQGHVPPSSGVGGFRRGRAASYSVRLPPRAGTPREIAGARDALRLVAEALDPDVGAQLAGSTRAWRRFVAANNLGSEGRTP